MYFKGVSMAIGVPGIDENEFQNLYEGDVDTYKSVLHSFIEKTPSVLNKLSAVTKENLADYAITVHGLKGACATICAEEARKAAYNLEQKSRADDLNGVLAENQAFIKMVEDLLVSLKDWFNSH
jgi:HPt (histidine-containing phosphotransfer) domain-containing protein